MTLPTISPLPTPPASTDDSTTFNTRAFAFLGGLPTLLSEINAWAAALPANITGTDFSATSTTSLTVGTGSKALTIQTGKQFQIGQPVRIADTTTPSNFMDGQVTAYNSGTGAMTVSVTSVGGAGTIAAWTISLIPGGAGSFATLAGTETLTGKTLTTPVISGTVSGTVAGRLGYSGGLLTYGNGAAQLTLVNTNVAQTLSNKTVDTADGNVLKIGGVALTAAALLALPIPIASGGTGAASASAARTALGLAIGTDVQAYDADLAAIAALTTTSFGRSLLASADGAAVSAAIGGLSVMAQSVAAAEGYITLGYGGVALITLQWKDFTATANTTTAVSFPTPFSSWSRAWLNGKLTDIDAEQNGPTVTAYSTTSATVACAYGLSNVASTLFAIGV